jgi:hypothetical protein
VPAVTRTLAIVSLLFAAACAPKAIISNPATDWRAVATDNDREKLRDWRSAFVDGLAQARAAGHGQAVDAEGVLLQPNAALGGEPIPNGLYRCRVTKLGAQSAGMLPYVAYPYLSCRVQPAGQLQGLAKLTGSQRPVGMVFPGDALRQVFLGTIVLGDETRAMQYGNDPDRDVAAFVERIGPARWRIVIPSPAFESRTDVIELIPAN